MSIITRAGKGSALTHNELDGNFTYIRDGYSLAIPKAQGYGIKVDSAGTPTFGWHDLFSQLTSDGYNGPTWELYSGGIKQLSFTETASAYFSYHIPHDYVVGSDIFIHSHWSHNCANVTGGDVTWSYELTYAKGHGQAAFGTPILLSGTQISSTIQYNHMIIESQASIAGGSPTQLNTSLIEPDGLIFGKVYLSANNITVSSGGVPNPFLHTVDIHYQSTSMGTKQRFPNFWA